MVQSQIKRAFWVVFIVAKLIMSNLIGINKYLFVL